MNLKIQLGRTLLTVAAILVATEAGATPGVPDVIQSALGLPTAPPCSLCHSTAEGGGPVTRAFGLALKERGMVAGDQDSLRAALQKLEADRVDSDGDGMTDVEALRAGMDPHSGKALPTLQPSYGCSASIGPRRPRRADFLLLGVGVLLASALAARSRRIR